MNDPVHMPDGPVPASDLPAPSEPALLVDGHVHLYDCYDLERFFTASWGNFLRYAAGQPFTGVLCLTETARDHRFAALADRAETGLPLPGPPGGPWRVARTGERESLRVDGPNGATLFLIAGRQLVTEEGLEVLALGTAVDLPDGLPLDAAVAHARSAGALPVVPWGFGMWWGRRGARLRAYLAAADAGAGLFLGDNSGRPALWPAPAHFRQGSRRGIRILPGSDPLPLPSEVWRPGSYGFRLGARWQSERPAESLRTALADPAVELQGYGTGETPLRFVRNQVRMQLRKRRGHATG